jgi:hypothetical protein
LWRDRRSALDALAEREAGALAPGRGDQLDTER